MVVEDNEQSHKWTNDVSWFDLNLRPTPVPTSDTRMGFPLTFVSQLKNTFTKKVRQTLSILLTRSQEEGIPTKGFLTDASYGRPVTTNRKTSQAKNGFTIFSLFLFQSQNMK